MLSKLIYRFKLCTWLWIGIPVSLRASARILLSRTRRACFDEAITCSENRRMMLMDRWNNILQAYEKIIKGNLKMFLPCCMICEKNLWYDLKKKIIHMCAFVCIYVYLQAFYYPPDAGLAMGGPGSSRFLRLEVHYHNPLLISGTHNIHVNIQTSGVCL